MTRLRFGTMVVALLLLGGAGAADAQIGWEVEWHSADLTLIDTTPLQPPEGKPFYTKQVLGQVGNWLITSDDVWDPVTCAPELTGGVFTGLVAYSRDDQKARSQAFAGRCYKGILELKTADPRSTLADLQTDIAALRTLLLNYRGQAVTTMLGGMGPLSGVGNGCNGTYPCVLKFPYYRSPDDAIAGTHAVANRHWYVVIHPPKAPGKEDLKPQVNLNIDLRYFTRKKTGGAANAFLNNQFSDLWSTTSGWTFAPITAHTLTPEKEAFYRLFGYYASRLDELGVAAKDLASRFGGEVVNPSDPVLANKNMLNPNPKVDLCQLRGAFGVSLRTYHPLKKYFGDGPDALYQVKNATPRQVLDFYQTHSCPFTTPDVTVLPFLSDGSILPAGTLMPVFEFRHPTADPCFALIDHVATGAGNLATLAAGCHADITTF